MQDFTPVIDANAIERDGRAFLVYGLGFQVSNFYGVHNLLHTIYTYEAGEVVVLYRLSLGRDTATVSNADGQSVVFDDEFAAYATMRSLFNGLRWQYVANVAADDYKEVA